MFHVDQIEKRHNTSIRFFSDGPLCLSWLTDTLLRFYGPKLLLPSVVKEFGQPSGHLELRESQLPSRTYPYNSHTLVHHTLGIA